MSVQAKTALIVGASRGLGLGLVEEYLGRGWHVIATSRGHNEQLLRHAAERANGMLKLVHLDVTDTEAIASLRATLADASLDLLFVSAGISLGAGDSAADASTEDFTRLMLTNTLAPAKIIEALGDLVLPDGVIAAMTSVLGSVANNTNGGWEIYRASKAALNTLLRSYAARHADRAIVAMHPGWVRTDMGGANATVGVDESARGMADVIGGRVGTVGCVYLDYQGKTIPW